MNTKPSRHITVKFLRFPDRQNILHAVREKQNRIDTGINNGSLEIVIMGKPMWYKTNEIHSFMDLFKGIKMI